MIEGAKNVGDDLEASNTFPRLLWETGFGDIGVETFAWLLDGRPKDLATKA